MIRSLARETRTAGAAFHIGQQSAQKADSDAGLRNCISRLATIVMSIDAHRQKTLARIRQRRFRRASRSASPRGVSPWRTGTPKHPRKTFAIAGSWRATPVGDACRPAPGQLIKPGQQQVRRHSAALIITQVRMVKAPGKRDSRSIAPFRGLWPDLPPSVAY